MKKTSYRYFTGPNPPAPFVHVAVAVPGSNDSLTGKPAHLDTGAFKTVIPRRLAEQLNLLPVREVQSEGLDGVVVVLTTFIVEMTIKDLSPVVLEVLAAEGESYILLGRDVLNRYRIVLDGLDQSFVIEEP